MDDFLWLTDWYASQCDGEWEHEFGVRIDTTDNPGWTVAIDLENTALEDRAFATLGHNTQSEVSWWSCRREGKQWRAAAARATSPRRSRFSGPGQRSRADILYLNLSCIKYISGPPAKSAKP